MTTQTKQVKLQGKHRPAPGGGWYGDLPGKTVPWLNVSGRWLERAGFKAGDRVEITIENNLLTIKNIAADGDPGN